MLYPISCESIEHYMPWACPCPCTWCRLLLFVIYRWKSWTPTQISYQFHNKHSERWMQSREKRPSKMSRTIINWPNCLWRRFENFSKVRRCTASSIWCNEIDQFTKSEFMHITFRSIWEILLWCHFCCTRILWYFALSIASASAVYIFLTALGEFSSNPAFTALKSVKHPIYEVPFPAVAVCNVNKISKKAAREYAEYL